MLRWLLCALLALVVPASLQAASPPPTHLGCHAPEETAADVDSTETKTEDEDWKVNEPHGPHQTLSFEVDEGTWMSADVSPDGKTVVFDLLGDLYTVPLVGGEATRLTQGLAWDYQPRWSPDGQEILFTSDRGGGNNLWILPVGGGEPWALTDAGEKDTNCGAWSPDGEWIAAKRRLTDTSSIGTTELWLYHRTGGEGIQVTKKDALPEASEPVFHPDGRFLYFSSRPSRFRYDRNPYQGIYQIQRFDRLSGEISPVTQRFGGAARPTISPDGRTLAFISRDGLETVLVLHDLDTGAERILYHGLDHDLQESFAWAGTYPSMDFTPDGRAVVLWTKGKLWKVDLSDGQAAPIPFHCQVELLAQDALRFPHDVASDRLQLRILRWMQASPRDGSILFSALGRLYRAQADGTDPQRLLRDDDDLVLEYAPRLSPDGKRLAYVSWSDTGKGHVWVADANGRNARRVTSIPGQYGNPTWNPQATELVVLKGSGATLRGGDLGDELWHEIYRIDLKTGERHFVTNVGNRGSSQRMPSPSFGPEGERIYFMQSAEDNKSELVSVRLDGSDKKTHLSVQYGEEFALSPDGRWVAFKHLHDAYVAPMPLTGTGTLTLGDSDGEVKVYKLTDGLADWLSWVDAGALTWAEANTLHRQTIANLLAKAEAERGKKDEEKEKKEEETEEKDPWAAQTVEITLEVPRAKPQGTLVLDGARLITMEGDRVIENGRLVIEGNRITALGRAANVEIPEGAEILDARGLTAIPGLVDAHAHMGYDALDILPQRDWQYYANLAYGVTATMDPSASTHLVFGQAEMVEAGVMKGPRIYSTGFILYGADIAGRAPTKSYEDALRHVRRMKKLGAFAIKSYMQPKRIQRQWYVKACREEQMLDFPEGGGNFEGNMGMILDGHTGIEHTTPVAPLYEDVLQMWSQTRVGYTPTFLVAYGGIAGEHWFYQHEPPIWSDEKLTRFTPHAVVESRSRRLGMMAYDGDWFHQTVARSAGELLRRGVLVNLGAHGQRQGLGCHWDLWALSQGGASNHDVLRAGTINPAAYIGLGELLGSLKEGKLADVVLLEGNPLEDIRQTNTVRWVIKNGELFDARTMDEQWPERIEREPFVWEMD